MSRTNPPQDNEIELSLFGPGIGECVVVHLGTGHWMVVDSCLNETGDRAVALDYLEQLGVDVAQQVKLIVVTHWHDDHIRGIAQLTRFCSSARFACSAALDSREFCTLIVADREIKCVENTSGVSEFAEVLEILTERDRGRYAAGPDHWACEGLPLYNQLNPYGVEVHALSPSSQSITDAKAQVAKLVPSINEVIRRFPSVAPNDLSVAILIKTAQQHLLLGADLERGRDERRGWQAVLGSAVCPRVMSSAYKVAHHGSENADIVEIWNQLLVANSHAIVTPYARGTKPLPSEEDVVRIKSRTKHAYCTAWPPTKSPTRRSSAVERTMREVLRSRRAIRKCPGQIRLRSAMDRHSTGMSVELFDGATQL